MLVLGLNGEIKATHDVLLEELFDIPQGIHLQGEAIVTGPGGSQVIIASGDKFSIIGMMIEGKVIKSYVTNLDLLALHCHSDGVAILGADDEGMLYLGELDLELNMVDILDTGLWKGSWHYIRPAGEKYVITVITNEDRGIVSVGTASVDFGKGETELHKIVQPVILGKAVGIMPKDDVGEVSIRVAQAGERIRYRLRSDLVTVNRDVESNLKILNA